MTWIRKPQEASHDPVSPYTRYLFAGHAEQSYPTHGNDTTNNGTTKDNNMANPFIVTIPIATTVEVNTLDYIIGADGSLCCTNDYHNDCPQIIHSNIGNKSIHDILKLAGEHAAQANKEYL